MGPWPKMMKRVRLVGNGGDGRSPPTIWHLDRPVMQLQMNESGVNSFPSL